MRDIHDPTTVDPIAFDGVVDADGHILEPPTLWAEFIESEFRDRALCVKVNADGLEYLVLDGIPSPSHAPGLLSELGRSNDSDLGGPPRPYLDGLPYGSMDSVERVTLLRHENIAAALLYPSIGIMWEADTEDVVLIQAHCRAYNRWIAEFCRESDGRLVAIAHLSLSDPDAAADELERAVEDGCRGAFIGSWTHNRRAPGHPINDRLWDVAQGLRIPIAIHPSVGALATRPNLYRGVLARPYSPHVHMGRDHVRQSFTTFFDYATFDRFPRLTVVCLESGAGWIGHTLDRLDELHAMMGRRADLALRPSEYFRRQCFISCDPAERTIGPMMETYGFDRFFWASDYPHPDHSIDYLRQMETLVEPLSDESRVAILGANVAALLWPDHSAGWLDVAGGFEREEHGELMSQSGSSVPRRDMRETNREIIADYRERGGNAPDAEVPLVLITTIGRASGRPHTTPLAVQLDGEDLVVAGSMGGSPHHPQWYLNLVADSSVIVEYEGHTYAARATTVPEGPERDRLLAVMNEVIPGLYRYQERARESRLIPIVVLRRETAE